jgi:hypothetical protein
LEQPLVKIARICVAVAGLSLATFGASAAVQTIAGTVVVATSNASQATLIWDATPRIVDLTAKPITVAEGDAAIEIDSLKLLQARASSLKADRLKLRVVFILSRQAASYGDPTMADRGPLLEMSAKRTDLLRNGPQWLAEIGKGHHVPGLSVAVLGEFPTSY